MTGILAVTLAALSGLTVWLWQEWRVAQADADYARELLERAVKERNDALTDAEQYANFAADMWDQRDRAVRAVK